MSIVDSICQIDWTTEENKLIARNVYSDACNYWERVVDHIYKGNEIRADQWMDYSEKQDEIKRLDRKRTEAHNKLLISAADLIDKLIRESEFDKDEYRLGNRTQIADFIALIAFELTNYSPTSTIEGHIRDDLAEMIHTCQITKQDIEKSIDNVAPGIFEH